MKAAAIVCLLASPLVFGITDDAEVRSLLENRVTVAKKAVGIAVGIIDRTGQRVIGAGKRSEQQPQAPDGDTVFEIGSISKTFTAILLADMVNQGEVRLDDPVSKFLPKAVTVPSLNGRTWI